MLAFLQEFFSHCILIRTAIDCPYGCALIFIALCVIFRIALWPFRSSYVDNIQERYVLITGCDSGFGENLCITLDNIGCYVFACCLTNEGIENLKLKCSSKLVTLLLDVRDRTNVQKVAKQVKAELGGKRLWGLVNNAGICGPIGPLEWLQREDFKDILETNLLGAIDIIVTMLPLMKSTSQEKARIINMTSILGTFHTPYSAPYCISKNALDVFSHILSIELASSNIEVIVLEPGAHKTNFVSEVYASMNGGWEKLSAEERSTFGESNFRRIYLMGSTFLKIFTATSLDKVMQAYHHALFSKRPKSRYLIGIDAALMKMASYIPRPILKTIYSLPGLLATPPPDWRKQTGNSAECNDVE